MATRYRVIITDYIHDSLQPERDVLGSLASVTSLDAHSEAELDGKLDDADALLVFHNVAIGERTIRQLQQCRVIARVGVGYDNIDLSAARARGIPVTNVPDYGTEEVADTALAMTLALTRGVVRLDLQLRHQDGPWDYRHAWPLRRLRGQVFGIVGFGRIGKAAALRAKALGMDVAFYDPLLADGHDKALGVRRVATLQELCRQSYVVSIHCPLTADTRSMINQESISWMAPGSYLVNTARGGVVDTAALPQALESGQLAGVALDVLPVEPPDVQDELIRIWKNPSHAAYGRLLINPHAAFYCEEGLREMRVKAAESCRLALLNEPLRNVVNG